MESRRPRVESTGKESRRRDRGSDLVGTQKEHEWNHTSRPYRESITNDSLISFEVLRVPTPSDATLKGPRHVQKRVLRCLV